MVAVERDLGIKVVDVVKVLIQKRKGKVHSVFHAEQSLDSVGGFIRILASLDLVWVVWNIVETGKFFEINFGPKRNRRKDKN